MDEASKKAIQEMNQKLSALPPLIMATPKPLSYEQTVQATATGVCRTTAPGGCTNKALSNLGDDIKSNAGKNTGNILDAVNTGANAVQLKMLEGIDNKLGPQLPGGISGFLQNF